MTWLLTFAGIGLLGYTASRLWTAAARGGWVYARGDAPKRGNVVGALGFEQVFEPEYSHVYEELSSLEVRAEHEASGDDDARP